MKRVLGTLLLGATTFAGGLIAGLLITPKSGKENRKWISDQSKDTKHWLEDKSHKILEDSEKRLDRVSKGIKKTVKDAVPDLYAATETLDFSEEEEEEEIDNHG